MELGKKFAEGAGHEVFEDLTDEQSVIKIPKMYHRNHFPISRVLHDLRLAEKHFAPYLAKSSAEPHAEYGYFLHQEKILHATHLEPDNLNSGATRDAFLDILVRNRQALREDHVGLDFMGLDGSVKSILSVANHYKGTLIDTLMISPLLKLTHTIGKKLPQLPIPKDLLELWNKEVIRPEITNIMRTIRGGTEKLCITDISLVHTHANTAHERLRSAVLQQWNRYMLRRFFDIEL